MPTTTTRRYHPWLLSVFGVALPAIAIVVELVNHLCAEVFFDPLPTVGHVLVLAAVPLANAFTARALWRGGTARLEATILAQAFAVAVAAVYAIIFIPVTPIAFIAIAACGLGFLPLAPLLSLLAGWSALAALRDLRGVETGVARRPRRTVAAGLAAGLLALLALQLPTTATRILLATAGSDDPATSRTGITWLRRIGERDLILRACYERPTGATDIVSAFVNVAAPVPPEKVREIYYRVTGRPFDLEPRPQLGRTRADRTLEWDVAQGGTTVGVAALRGLELASSRIDGSVDARAALGYVEWTFELRNDAPIAREARAEVALPPGGVVSRVTLWIDGVEREAAFAGRDVTRRAYERVVRARRDPILVTTSAPDRILVQCFPVAANGGTMKARIGITAPLALGGRQPETAATLGLPYFTQRNFGIPAAVKHAVWIASKGTFAPPAGPLAREQPASGGEEIRGAVPEPAAPGPFASVTAVRPSDALRSWTRDRAGGATSRAALLMTPAGADAIIKQTIEPAPLARATRLVIVIDGSEAMKTGAAAVATALAALPAHIPVAITVADDDEARDLLGGVAAAPDRAVAAARVRGARYEGGADSVAALGAAWDLAAAAPGGAGAVLWIHGPQPVLLRSPDELRQRMERRPDGPPLYTYAAVGGENLLLAGLAGAPGVKAVPRYTTDADDLRQFLAQLGGDETRLAPIRTRETGAGARAGADAEAGVETSDHLARLWARDRIEALAVGRPGAPASVADREAALALARQYHLVTPVSGAVVLDTAAATEAVAGDASGTPDVPTVPEPETWALIALAAAVLLGSAVARRRRFAGGARAA
jgi:hypothetical protein